MTGHRITAGYLFRHLPPQSNVGLDIAVLDVAQDHLLWLLHDRGLFDLLIFKGGTAIRKLHAGSRGRFSTDIDVALRDADDDRVAVADLVAETVDGAVVPPFSFTVTEHRGRHHIHPSLTEPIVDIDVLKPLKLDVAPPPWLAPESRAFVPAGIHDRYGINLPQLPSMRLEEVLAEKIARLCRLDTARDAFDLCWAATTTPQSQFDRDLVRRLVVLKVWVDVNGLGRHWQPAVGPSRFDPQVWLRTDRDWDDENIGLLAHPPPTLEELERQLTSLYGWLADGDEDVTTWARADNVDRAGVVAAIAALDGAPTAEQLWAR